MIAIIDYEMGNLRSVQKALERLGQEAVIVRDPVELSRAERVILPGVGAFEDAMSQLRQRQLVEPIRKAVAAGKPFLGICLGMQLLFDVSYEGGEFEGLGLVPGKVLRFDVPPPMKVPHMGWNQGRIVNDSPLLAEIPDQTHFYFVHSFYCVPEDPSVVVLETDYGQPICSMLSRDNLHATQFHPEKSQSLGLRLLQNFAELPVASETPG